VKLSGNASTYGMNTPRTNNEHRKEERRVAANPFLIEMKEWWLLGDAADVEAKAIPRKTAMRVGYEAVVRLLPKTGSVEIILRAPSQSKT
jgi:hypothetical protein